MSSGTIFVVDDDPKSRESIVAVARRKGLRAEGFSTAGEFLSQYDPKGKGCIVIDIRMANGAGLDLLRTLKDRKASLPALVLTSNADVPLAVKAMREGAVGVLEKPASHEELWEAIQQALEISQQ